MSFLRVFPGRSQATREWIGRSTLSILLRVAALLIFARETLGLATRGPLQSDPDSILVLVGEPLPRGQLADRKDPWSTRTNPKE